MGDKTKVLLFANHNNGTAITKYLHKRKDAELVCVVVQQDPPGAWWKSVSEFCKKNNIPQILFTTNKELLKKVEHKNFDLIVSASWRHKIPGYILKLASMGGVNMHNSLLPKYRSAYANSWPLYYGDTHTGVTLHYMTEKFDDGSIIGQKTFPILPTDTARQTWENCNKAYLAMFKELWPQRSKWPALSKRQKGKASFYSIKDFEDTNEINLEKKVKPLDFINFLRSRTFEPYYRNAFFKDPKSGKKIYLSVNLSE